MNKLGLMMTEASAFDVDTYKILRRFLARPPRSAEIVELGA